MKTIEQLKKEIYEDGLNDYIKEVFLGVFKDADVTLLSPKDRELYDIRMKSYRDSLASIDVAIEDGIRQGIKKSKINIARTMKADGVDPAFIAKHTGVSVEEIQNL